MTQGHTVRASWLDLGNTRVKKINTEYMKGPRLNNTNTRAHKIYEEDSLEQPKKPPSQNDNGIATAIEKFRVFVYRNTFP